MTGGVAYISFGSNIEPAVNIPAALDQLDALHPILVCSPVYRSAALERPTCPDFLNGVCQVSGAPPPRELKLLLRGIEEALGRRRGPDRYAPRTVDLDIILYDGLIVQEEDLRLPDPDIQIRPFLAIPLLDISPDLRLPGVGESLAAIVARMDRGLLTLDHQLTDLFRARFSR